MGKELSIGAVHIPLRRMEKEGLISSFLGESTSIRGGRRKKIYRLTSLSLAALKESKKLNDKLWTNFKKVVTLPESR
jgi:DNA-binding PadR family transcriptional regulator